MPNSFRLPKNFLAPISEYTNSPFRLLCQKHGCNSVIVPLVNATAIARRADAVSELFIDKREKNVGVQLFGSAPSDFKIAAKKITENFPKIKFLDINCGCPMENIIAVGAGASLLNNSKRVCEIISAAKSSGYPVSVKMRLLPTIDKTVDFCKMIEKAGADFIIVHGRKPEQFYSGSADWGAIKKIHEEISLPLVGNGDIKTRTEGESRVSEGFCDSFMIGREAMRNPLCFENRNLQSFDEQKKIFSEYLRIAEKTTCIGITDARQKALFFFRGCKNCASLRAAISQAKTMAQLVSTINKYFYENYNS